MKELRVIFLVLAIGLSGNFPVTPKGPIAYYPNTIKGGLQTTPKDHPATAGVEGKYEYYMQYLKFKQDYQKPPAEEVDENSKEIPSCVLTETPKVAC